MAGLRDSFDKGAAIIGKALDLEAECGLGRYLKCFTAFHRFPPVRSGQKNFQIAGEYLHDLLISRVEFILAGKHDAKCLPRAVRENDGAAGDLAVKVNIGFLDYRYILEFRHDPLLS